MHELGDSVKKIRTFASGGQGILTHGIDLPLNRKIAVKSLRPELCDKAKQRRAFLTEAQITAQLEHPAIVPIHTLHKEQGDGLAVTMKMIHGENLQKFLMQIIQCYQENGFNATAERQSLRFRIDIFLKICDALEYAHSRNIMHCDLKPENIMIGKYHDAYLMDWGIAHPIRNEEYDPATWIKKDQVSGTPAFVSPEAARGEYCDHRADIYSMGLILFEIVTLNKAFTGQSATEVVEKVRYHQLNPLKHHFGASIDTDLKEIILKAISYDPEERYQNMYEFSSDIRKYLQQDEVIANPDGFFRKIFRNCIVKHGKAMLITTLACLLATVGFSALNLYDVLQRERTETIRKKVIALRYIDSMGVANTFDHELSEMEHNLHNCTKTMAIALQGKIQI